MRAPLSSRQCMPMLTSPRFRSQTSNGRRSRYPLISTARASVASSTWERPSGISAAKFVFLVSIQSERTRRHDTKLMGEPSSNRTRTRLPLIDAVESKSPREGPTKGDDVHCETEGAWALSDPDSLSSAGIVGSPWQDGPSRGTGGRGPRSCSADALPASILQP